MVSRLSPARDRRRSIALPVREASVVGLVAVALFANAPLAAQSRAAADAVVRATVVDASPPEILTAVTGAGAAVTEVLLLRARSRALVSVDGRPLRPIRAPVRGDARRGERDATGRSWPRDSTPRDTRLYAVPVPAPRRSSLPTVVTLRIET